MKASLSPSKGKAKEESQWQTGWWDFQPLCEFPAKPLEWSTSCVVFTAHATQPLLTGRHLASSKIFAIAPPPNIINPPGAYAPPSVIAVSPTDEWLFAYFSRRDGSGGAGCLWQKNYRVDTWIVRQCWQLAPGAGTIRATWLCDRREWTYSQRGLHRLPYRGPLTPISDPTLLLVMENRQIAVLYLRHYEPAFKLMRMSLDHPATVEEGQSQVSTDAPNSSDGVRRCFKAAVALAYNEHSMLIATRSHRLPSGIAPTTPPFDPMNLGLQIEAPSGDLMNHEWELWEEDSFFEVSEVQLLFNGRTMSLKVTPMGSVQFEGKLSTFEFVCPPQALGKWSEPGKMFLAAGRLDFRDYSSPPGSELSIIPFTKLSSQVPAGQPHWVPRREVSRSYTGEVLAFIGPCPQYDDSIFAVFLQSHGSLPRPVPKSKQASIGSIKVLNIADLTENTTAGRVPVLCHVDKVGRDLPLQGIISPNHTLLYTMSLSMKPPQSTVHVLQNSKNVFKGNGPSLPVLSLALASSLRSKKTSSDITRTISGLKTLAEVTEVLYHAFAALDSSHDGLSVILTWEMIGVVVDVYRAREQQTTDPETKKYLREAWQVAHDICSLVVINMAFEDCSEETGYDLDAVWQLISLSHWVLDFLEKLMKHCVVCSIPGQADKGSEGQQAPAIPLDSPLLLPLVHPFVLMLLSGCTIHVKKFRNYLASLDPAREMAKTARKALLDIVDSSGVRLEPLEPLLKESLTEVMGHSITDARASLAGCRPTQSMHPRLQAIIQKLTQSTVIDKPTLFLKPSDLLDGMINLSISTTAKKDQKDVVSKGKLPDTPLFLCLRCGGRSNPATWADHVPSLKWKLWGRAWTFRCICNGAWGPPRA
ncbi:hypothetical protein BDN72DRAFT_830846 [Pluteus cervinus]|uniref:Uncharacterized protein n=1 Tax=Pluteus cervinus TaxID=181527 RepID=A0ACD3BFC7_9AGAR|nr:hypothetical protein BDN72DRAFT_830846 [Pluteus cervinus]